MPIRLNVVGVLPTQTCSHSIAASSVKNLTHVSDHVFGFLCLMLKTLAHAYDHVFEFVCCSWILFDCAPNLSFVKQLIVMLIDEFPACSSWPIIIGFTWQRTTILF